MVEIDTLGNVLSDSHATRKTRKLIILQGTQQRTNPTTIAMAIFSTFLFLFARCCSALTDC